MSQSMLTNPIGSRLSRKNTGIVSANQPGTSRLLRGIDGNPASEKSNCQSGRPSAGRPVKLSNP